MASVADIWDVMSDGLSLIWAIPAFIAGGWIVLGLIRAIRGGSGV